MISDSLNATYDEISKFENDSFNDDTRRKCLDWSNKIANLDKIKYEDELEDIFQYIFPQDGIVKNITSDCIDVAVQRFREFLLGNYYIEERLKDCFEKLVEIFQRKQVILGDGLENKSENVLEVISKVITLLLEEVEPILVQDINTNINEIIEAINILKTHDGKNSINVKDDEKILTKFFRISNNDSSVSVKVQGNINKTTSIRSIDEFEENMELNSKRLEEEFIDFFGIGNNEILDKLNEIPKGIDENEIINNAVNVIPVEDIVKEFISNTVLGGQIVFDKENIEIRDKLINIYNKIPEKSINILFKIDFIVKRAILFKKLRKLEENPNDLNIVKKLKDITDDKRILSRSDLYTKNVYKKYIIESSKIIFRDMNLEILKKIVLNEDDEWNDLIDVILNNKIVRIKESLNEKKRTPIYTVQKYSTMLHNMEDLFKV